jgi:predicted nuclease of restriction endonuclease-like (RecB) superfamily
MRIDREKARNFYEIGAEKNHWSGREEALTSNLQNFLLELGIKVKTLVLFKAISVMPTSKTPSSTPSSRQPVLKILAGLK